jgi:hypothetical protein
VKKEVESYGYMLLLKDGGFGHCLVEAIKRPKVHAIAALFTRYELTLEFED